MVSLAQPKSEVVNQNPGAGGEELIERLFVPWETDDVDLGRGQPSVCSLSQLFYS